MLDIPRNTASFPTTLMAGDIHSIPAEENAAHHSPEYNQYLWVPKVSCHPLWGAATMGPEEGQRAVRYPKMLMGPSASIPRGLLVPGMSHVSYQTLFSGAIPLSAALPRVASTLKGRQMHCDGLLAPGDKLSSRSLPLTRLPSCQTALNVKRRTHLSNERTS